MDENKLDTTRPWQDDPEMGDMEDKEYREEIFQSLKDDNVPPEHLPDLKLRKQYSKWLKTQ
jgi:hypothetical protein